MKLKKARLERLREVKQDIETVKYHLEISVGARRAAFEKLLFLLKLTAASLRKSK